MGSAKTAFSVSGENAASLSVDGLIVPVVKKPGEKSADGKDKKRGASESIDWSETLKQLDKALQNQIRAVADEEKFDGGKGKTLTFRKGPQDKVAARRIILLGLGEARKLDARNWTANVAKAVSTALGLKDAGSVGIVLPESDRLDAAVLAHGVVDAVYQATYRSAESKDKPPELGKAVLVAGTRSKNAVEGILERAQVMAEAKSLVKDLANRPANLKTTDTMVETAKAVAKLGVEAKIQSSVAWIEKNMPCFYTVARGSLATDPPKFIRLSYQPKGGQAKKHIAVVGKSVMFDTGGYQVKPGDYMVTMKGDMTGGAVALATMQAVAKLKPRHVAVSVYLAATPNKIDSDAMVPDSIVNTTCGKKVEIRHTDAEGRLTLIDAVAQAVKDKPDEIITVATLTGAASAAVGYYIALMGNNQEFRGKLEKAGRLLGEPIQTLDVTEDDFDNIKSKLDGADIINTSQRKHRGAQSAAAFVMSGAPEELPFAHMDIAGADMTADEKATGISLKTVVQYILEEEERLGGRGAESSKAPAAGTSAKPGKSKPSAKKPPAKKAAPQKAARPATGKSPAKPPKGKRK